MLASTPFNKEARRIRIFTWIYGLILVVTISGTVLSRSIQNQTTTTYNGTTYDFQHPWFQTWFYALAKFLCIIIIFHPDYNTTYGTSPPNVLFPVSAAAFVSSAAKNNNNQKNNNNVTAKPTNIQRNHALSTVSKESERSCTNNGEIYHSADDLEHDDDDMSDIEMVEDDDLNDINNREYRSQSANDIDLETERAENKCNDDQNGWSLSWKRKHTATTKKKGIHYEYDDNDNDGDDEESEHNIQNEHHQPLMNKELSKEMRILSYDSINHSTNYPLKATKKKQHILIRKKKKKKDRILNGNERKGKNKPNVIDMRPIKRAFTWNMFIKQQSIYFIFGLLCILGELFLNISLYYLDGSIFTMLLCILIIFGSLYRCSSISRIYHLVGLLFLFVGFIIIALATFAEMKDLEWNTNDIIFSLCSLCIGTLFISLYLTFYQYLYEKWNLYWRLCLTLKNQSIALSSVQPSQRDNIAKLYVKFNNVRLEQETKLIFIHWNHIKFVFMEGIYGLIITSIIISIQSLFTNNNNNNNTNTNYWHIIFYDDFNSFITCLKSNYLYFILIFILIISHIFYEIILEDSRYHLSPYHSRIIYVLSILFIWSCNILIHYVISPNVDNIPSSSSSSNDNNIDFYGEILSWYDLIELMGLLFIIGGLLIHDDKYVVFINKMIEHNDTIKEQYKLFKLHEYWNNVYFNREKSRLLGHSPRYLNPEYQSDTEYSILSKSVTTTNHTNHYHNKPLHVQQYEVSLISSENKDNKKDDEYLNIETRDDGHLKGAMNLLLGKDLNESFCNKPSKYYPAFYE